MAAKRARLTDEESEDVVIVAVKYFLGRLLDKLSDSLLSSVCIDQGMSESKALVIVNTSSLPRKVHVFASHQYSGSAFPKNCG